LLGRAQFADARRNDLSAFHSEAVKSHRVFVIELEARREFWAVFRAVALLHVLIVFVFFDFHATPYFDGSVFLYIENKNIYADLGLPTSVLLPIPHVSLSQCPPQAESINKQEFDVMPRCELSGKRPQVKNKVSHSNIKTKSIALPNVLQKRLYSPILKEMVNLKIATSTIRSIDHVGSFDKFVLNQPDVVLSKRALTVKNRMLRKLRKKA
jgi:large subunit ribosomal protein L28